MSFYFNDYSYAGNIDKFIDTRNFIVEGFEYYKYNKEVLGYKTALPTELIKMYYDLNPTEVVFDNLKKSFIKKYVINESALEGVNDLTLHGKEEIEGFKEMYIFMHSLEFNDKFDIFSLKDLNAKLFSCTPYPEFGGNFRREFAHLSGVKSDLCDWSYIYQRLLELDSDVSTLRELSPIIKNSCNAEARIVYLDKCVELGCKLIKVHPFSDGNGRTIRCFINKLLEDVGFPSVYVKSQEREEYLTVMNRALDFEDYKDIKMFYHYKICDSIIELDINNMDDKNDNNINDKGKIKKLK